MNKHLNLNRPAPKPAKPVELTPEQLHERIIAMASNTRVEIAKAFTVHGGLNSSTPEEVVERAFALADAFILKAYNVKFDKPDPAEETKEAQKGE